MLNRSKLWAAMLLLGVFAAGVAIGGPVWGALTEDHRDERGRRGSSSEPKERERKSYSERLQEDLGLNVDQRAAVDSILDASQAEMHAVWRDMRAQIDTLRQEVAGEIMQLLDETQRAKYTDMIERSRHRGGRDRVPRNDRQHD